MTVASILDEELTETQDIGTIISDLKAKGYKELTLLYQITIELRPHTQPEETQIEPMFGRVSFFFPKNLSYPRAPIYWRRYRWTERDSRKYKKFNARAICFRKIACILSRTVI